MKCNSPIQIDEALDEGLAFSIENIIEFNPGKVFTSFFDLICLVHFLLIKLISININFCFRFLRFLTFTGFIVV